MLPVLYTFRRCPYAMRARMALAYAGIDYEVREVVLRDKPPSMLDSSPKGTVPVMLVDGAVIDESIDIVAWALNQHDPQGWRQFNAGTLQEMTALIVRCEEEFKPDLDRYKYAERYPQRSKVDYRSDGEAFIRVLEQRLAAQTSAGHHYLFGDRMSYADVAIFPFIRQYAHVDKAWFDRLPHGAVQTWLNGLLTSELFLSVMKKYPQWHDGDSVTLFSV